MSQGTGRPTGSASASGGGSGGSGGKKWGDTTSKRGEVSRIFVGNTDPKNTTCNDLENKFSPYGKIQGIDINANGFSFVQFEEIVDAQRAVSGENGTVLKGRKIEVRMFDKSGPPKRKGGGRERSRSPVNRNLNFGGFPPPPPPMYGSPIEQPPITGNDIEIIAVTKEQWAYAEMIEQRLKRETPIKYIDVLFLHSPQHLNITLSDLYDRRTLYAIVVAPTNEEHKSLTLHILHSNSEHRNILLDAAINLITNDFRAFMVSRGLPVPPMPLPSSSSSGLSPTSIERGLSSNGAPPTSATYSTNVTTGDSSKRLPDEISYLLKTTISEGGVQFLSLSQIDSIIDYFSRERDRLTSHARQQQQQLRTQTETSSYSSSSGYLRDNMYPPPQTQTQSAPKRQEYATAMDSSVLGASNMNATSSNSSIDPASSLLDNPQVKAALNSLIQYGAISNTSNQSSQVNNLNSLASKLMSSYTSKSVLDNNGSLAGSSLGGGGGSSLNVNSMSAQLNEAPSYLSTSASIMPGGQQTQTSNLMTQQQNLLRRHPLFGTEIGSQGSNTVSSAYSNLGGYRTTGQY